MAAVPITFEEVAMRISFATWRLEELKVNIGGDRSGRRRGVRLQLMQEFFFHLFGARELLTLLINENRGLRLDPERISMGEVIKALSSDDPLSSMLRELTVDPRKKPFPSSPYTDEAYIYRAVLYRNQVAHRHRAPVNIEIQDLQGTGKVFLYLDPRNYSIGPSRIEALTELTTIHDLLAKKYTKIGEILKAASAPHGRGASNK